MADDLRKSTEETMERFYSEEEHLEQLAYDILNLSDKIRNAARTSLDLLEEGEQKKAVEEMKNCLSEMMKHIDALSAVAHEIDDTSDKQRENLNTIQQVVDFLSCDWDSNL